MGLRGLVRRSAGPVVVFPPSEGTLFGEFESAGCGVVSLARGFAKEGLIAPADASDIPPGSVAYIESPSDPLGQLLSPSDAVRLARACQWLVIDERYVEFSGQSLLALAADFENMIVVRSFEVWAALEQTPCAWAVIPPAVARSLQEEECMPTAEAMAAALATLDNLSSVEATLRLVREERSRLFRLMRKLSFLEPVPTWGPFLAARAVVVDRDEIVESLRHRRIHVYAPAHPSLDRYVRFGIGSRSEMDRLRRALLELAPALVA